MHVVLSGSPESSTLNSALMRNLPFHRLAELLRHRRVVGRRRAGPDHRVDQALLLDRLQQRQHGRAGEVEHHAAALAGLLHQPLGEAGGVGDRHVSRMLTPSRPFSVGELVDAAVDQVEAGLVRRRRRPSCRSAPARTRGLRAAEARVVRAHVDGREVGAGEAALVPRRR